FFQAEDGIRDFHVTGVQTCALPIFARHGSSMTEGAAVEAALAGPASPSRANAAASAGSAASEARSAARSRGVALGRAALARPRRSEERRVGRAWSAGGCAQREHERR